MYNAGKGLRALMLSFTRQLIFILPVAFLLSRFFDLHAVWFAFPIAEAATLVLAFVLFIQLTKTDFKKLDN